MAHTVRDVAVLVATGYDLPEPHTMVNKTAVHDPIAPFDYFLDVIVGVSCLHSNNP